MYLYIYICVYIYIYIYNINHSSSGPLSGIPLLRAGDAIGFFMCRLHYHFNNQH